MNNMNIADLPVDEVSPPVRLKSFGNRGLSVRESQEIVQAVNALMQLIQLDEYRTQELQKAARVPLLDEGHLKELEMVTEDMAQLLSDLEKLTPAVATTARRITPDIQAGLEEWSKGGKLTLPEVADATLASNNWWFDPWNVRGHIGGPEPIPDIVRPEILTEIEHIAEGIEQTINSLGAQFAIEFEHMRQEVTMIVTGNLSPADATSVVHGIGAALHHGSSGGGGEFSAVTIGALFGSLIGFPAIGVLVGLIIDFLERLLAEEEEPNV